MGKLEKLVVLAVLFTAALVLALAFNRGSDDVEASGPLSGARQLLGLEADAGSGAEQQAGTVSEHGEASPYALSDTTPSGPGSGGASAQDQGHEVQEENVAEQAPSLLLDAGAAHEASFTDSRLSGGSSELTLEPRSDPTKRILVDMHGLRPSFLEEYVMYTLAEGDTWSSLAQRFYQDGRYTRNLHLANEDLDQLTPGKDILVPVFDFLAVDAGLQTGADAAPVAPADPDTQYADESIATSSMATSSPAASSGTPSANPTTSPKLLEYEVRSGDTLSDISLAVFGTVTRWKEILEANRDKLRRPESLQVGMKLKIPAGGKLPAPVKKPETKAKTTERAGKTTATTKKKKVL